MTLSHLGSEFRDSPGVTVHDPEDPFLRNFVVEDCLNYLVPDGDGLFGTHLRQPAIEREPTIGGARGRAARPRQAAGCVVMVAEVLAAKGGAARFYCSGERDGTRGSWIASSNEKARRSGGLKSSLFLFYRVGENGRPGGTGAFFFWDEDFAKRTAGCRG